METLTDPHPLTYRRLCLDLRGAVFFCRNPRMLITIANVPLRHPQMLQMASNLFTLSPPFMFYYTTHLSGCQLFLQSLFVLFQLFYFASIEI